MARGSVLYGFFISSVTKFKKFLKIKTLDCMIQSVTGVLLSIWLSIHPISCNIDSRVVPRFVFSSYKWSKYEHVTYTHVSTILLLFQLPAF